MKNKIEIITGMPYCSYSDKNYIRTHHIFNVGEYAIITGNGGIYASSTDYFKELDGNLDRAYLHRIGNDCKKLPPSNFIVNRKVKILARQYWASCGVKICLVEVDNWQFVISMDYLKPIKRRNATMNPSIVEMFPSTKDALLIEKWFGDDLESPLMEILIKGKERELLAAAIILEKQEKDVGIVD